MAEDMVSLAGRIFALALDIKMALVLIQLVLPFPRNQLACDPAKVHRAFNGQKSFRRGQIPPIRDRRNHRRCSDVRAKSERFLTKVN